MMSIEDKIQKYKETSNKKILEDILYDHRILIKKLATFYFKRNLKTVLYEDIKAAAVEGLILAINKYDSEKSDIFEPYARLWIKAKVREYILKNMTPFSINDTAGRHYFTNFYKIEKNESNPYLSFLNAFTLGRAYALPDEDSFQSSSITPEESLLKKEQTELFSKEISSFEHKMTDIEKFIFQERILAETPMTLETISTKFDCTNQNISYKEKKLLEKFKKHILCSKNVEVFRAGTIAA